MLNNIWGFIIIIILIFIIYKKINNSEDDNNQYKFNLSDLIKNIPNITSYYMI